MKRLVLYFTMSLVLTSCGKNNNTGNLEGNVYFASSIPVSNAQVNLSSKYMVYTDDSGYFLFSNIPIGEYSLSISYQNQIVYSKSVNIASDNTKSMDITIQSNSEDSYSDITGKWTLSTRSDFSNNSFTGILYADLNLTQTNELFEGYSQDVYKVTGTFSNLGWLIERNGVGTGYLLQNASGNIINGGINQNSISHNIEFDLASSNIHIRGTAPLYKTMFGDMTVKIDMTAVYGTDDGVITLTGMWDAVRN